jgi:hypothetical protein
MLAELVSISHSSYRNEIEAITSQKEAIIVSISHSSYRNVGTGKTTGAIALVSISHSSYRNWYQRKH